MYDVVIIGSGAAGLTTALNISENLEVLIITACERAGANTKLAQGGIAASWRATKDEQQLHIEDTNIAGCYRNDQQAVQLLVSESSTAIDFLIAQGTNFDRGQRGYDLTAEAAHSVRRIFHADGDSTGQQIYQALLSAAKGKSNITISDSSLVTEVVEIERGHYQVRYQANRLGYQIDTNNLVIACGGYGNLFKASTNSKFINGCNLVIAKSLGLAVSNLQYLQFHPTGFKANDGHYHLLTESLRGEGARFYSPQSGYFMRKYHNLGDIAPRDVTSRAVHHELMSGNQVFLDCRPVAEHTDIHNRFKTVSQTVVKSGYDLATDLIPICPVAHYSIGGITIDLNGQTSKPGVYAVGESAMSGVHGANRLASNSLLECIVYGMRTAKVIGKQGSYRCLKTELTTDSSPINSQVQEILTASCNIVRTDDQLQAGLAKLNQLDENDHPLVAVAKDIITSCLTSESIGCHYKECSE